MPSSASFPKSFRRSSQTNLCITAGAGRSSSSQFANDPLAIYLQVGDLKLPESLEFCRFLGKLNFRKQFLPFFSTIRASKNPSQ